MVEELVKFDRYFSDFWKVVEFDTLCSTVRIKPVSYII